MPGGGFLVRIEFRHQVDSKTESLVAALATVWKRAVSNGAFCLPPGGPRDNYIEPEGIVAFDNVIEWPISKFRADPVGTVKRIYARFDQPLTGDVDLAPGRGQRGTGVVPHAAIVVQRSSPYDGACPALASSIASHASGQMPA